jgi:curved DNA-binding protein CbpA
VTEAADLYHLLQVDPSAEPDVIAAAYKRLALRYHPDHNLGDPSALEQMKRINEAFRILSRPELRAAYDARNHHMPELEVVPGEVTLRDFDPASREINFSVRLRHASGPPFDPAKHRIDLTLLPPWHHADVHWHWSRETLPADVEFTLVVDHGFLRPGATFTGEIEVTVAARD